MTRESRKDYDILWCKDTEEWLTTRRLGASSIGTLMLLNPHSSPQQMWLEMQGIVAKESTPAMARGHRMEIVVANDFFAATGGIVMPESVPDFTVVDKKEDWMTCSPDRLFWLPGTPVAERTFEGSEMLECKTCTVWLTPEDIFEKMPYWYAQVQWQMGICRKSRCFLAWIYVGDPDMPFNFVEVRFNRKYFEREIEKGRRFWFDNYLGGSQPAEVMNADDAKLLWSSSIADKSVVTSDPQLVEDVKRYNALGATYNAIDAERKDIQTRIRTAMQESEFLYTDSRVLLATWKSTKPSETFDEAAFKTDHPDLYKEYTHITDGGRRLVIKDPFAAKEKKSAIAKAKKASVVSTISPGPAAA